MTTTDPTLATRQAIRTVARRLLATAVKAAQDDIEWEDYPEISQDDWQAVLADVKHLAERGDVTAEHYESAYRHLTARATQTEEGPQ